MLNLPSCDRTFGSRMENVDREGEIRPRVETGKSDRRDDAEE